MKKIKLNKMQIIAGFAGVCLALCVFIGYSTPAETFYASDVASYDNTNSGMSSDNVQDALDELYQCVQEKENPTPSVTLSVGDYVQMTPTLSSYTTEPKYTGYDTTETINPKELNLWRVIRVNDDGTYDAVSDYISSTKVTFQGKTGYQSYIYYLNVLASKYENTKFTVDSRYMGYNGQTLFITDTSKFDWTNQVAPWTSSTSGTSAEEYLGRGDELYQTDYDLVKAAYGGNANPKLFDETAWPEYWIASRDYWYYSENYFYFGGRLYAPRKEVISSSLTRYANGVLDGCGSDGFNYCSSSNYLRPIITLRSDLKATGSGTSADPYVLQ